jgi:predicted nuclease of restriction endonuclease-like (RecB) superfamily
MTDLIPPNYKQVVATIKSYIQQAQYKSFQLVNKEALHMNWQIGKLLSEQTKNGWGKSIVETLSREISIDYPGVKGFSVTNLWYMKQFYETYYDRPNLQQLVGEIPWGQNLLIMTKVKDELAREYYLTKCIENGWSRGVLEEEIKFDSFSKAIKFQNNFNKSLPIDKLAAYRMQFKDEYNLSFLNLDIEHSEKQLEDAIVKNIVKVLGQFGKDFCFMGRQFPLKASDKEYFVDILMYQRRLRAMIAIEIKVTDFKPEYSQQLNWYLHLLDKHVKYPDDSPSIGILICKSKDSILVEYALELVNNPMGVASYSYRDLPKELAQFLPDEEKIKQLIID